VPVLKGVRKRINQDRCRTTEPCKSTSFKIARLLALLNLLEIVRIDAYADFKCTLTILAIMPDQAICNFEKGHGFASWHESLPHAKSQRQTRKVYPFVLYPFVQYLSRCCMHKAGRACRVRLINQSAWHAISVVSPAEYKAHVGRSMSIVVRHQHFMKLERYPSLPRETYGAVFDSRKLVGFCYGTLATTAGKSYRIAEIANLRLLHIRTLAVRIEV
jgi:hypothetical protein